MDATRRYLLMMRDVDADDASVSTADGNDEVAAKSPSGLSPMMAKSNGSAKRQLDRRGIPLLVGWQRRENEKRTNANL
jgi:hypothetical protein